MGDLRIWLRQHAYQEHNNYFRTVWTLYLSFYTVLLTFNVAALAWLYGEKTPLPLVASRGVVVCSIVIQDLLTAVTSMVVAGYSVSVRRTIIRCQDQLIDSAPSDASGFLSEPVDAPTPARLAVWAGCANAVAMLSLVTAWLWLIRQRS